MSKRVHFSKQGLKGKGLTKVGTGGKKGEAKTRKKPEWDDSIKDLKIHKLSREELERRHENAQSKNADAARHDLYEKAKGGLDLESSGNLRPPTAATASSSKFTSLQRALHGKELHEVLAESDRALAVVKDIFGDDPKRYIGQPNVTIAPHVVTNKKMFERTILESKLDGPGPTALASPGGIRDESIVEMAPKKPALNDLPPPPEFSLDDSDVTLTPELDHNGGYQPAIDLSRFHQVIHLQEACEPGTKDSSLAHLRATSTRSGGPTTTLDGRVGLVNQETQTLNGDRAEGERALQRPINDSVTSSMSELSSIPVDLSAGQPHGGGAIDSEASLDLHGLVKETTGERTVHPLQLVNRAPPPLRVVKSPEVPLEEDNKVLRKGDGDVVGSGYQSTTQGHDDLKVLEKLVQDLEYQLVDYEQETGYEFPVKKPTVSQGTFSSITASLLASVTKLTHYLKQSEVQLKGEVAVRGQLLYTMTEQQNLMDALTTDMVKLKDENLALQTKLDEVVKTTAEQTVKLQEELSEVHKKLSSLPQGVFPPPPPLVQCQQPSVALPESSHTFAHLPLLETHHVTTASATSTTYLSTSTTSSMTELPSFSPLPTAPSDHHMKLEHAIQNPLITTSLSQPAVTTHTTYTTLSSLRGSDVPPPSGGVVYAQVSPLSHTGGIMLPPPRFDSPLARSSATLGLPSHPLHTNIHVPPHNITSQSFVVPPYHTLPFTTPTSNLVSSSSLSTDEYAPSPPPLSIALEVPALSSFLNTTPVTSTYTLTKPGFATSSHPSFGSLTPHLSSQWLPKQGDRPKPSLPSVDLLLSSLVETDIADSTSFPDLKLSVEQMSTLARSVLEELSHQRQQQETHPRVPDISISSDTSNVPVPEFVKCKDTSMQTTKEGIKTQQASVCTFETAVPNVAVTSLPALNSNTPMIQVAQPKPMTLSYPHNPSQQVNSMERTVTTATPSTNSTALPLLSHPVLPAKPKNSTQPSDSPATTHEYKATTGPNPGWFALSSHLSH